MSRRISPLAVGAVVAVVLRAVPLSGVPMQTRTVSNPSDRRVERLDPALDRLIAPDAQIDVLGQGYSWSEGPVWVKDGGYLLFSDVKENTVYKWKQGEGAKPYLKPSGYTGATPRGAEMGSNGLTLDATGHLVLCQHGDRRVARMDAPLASPQATFTTLAGRYQDKRFNSPNDLVFKSNGDLYLTDPGVRHGEGMGRPGARAAVRRRFPTHVSR